jgi:SAM-dependent MidA family methyltransferase
MLNPLEQKIVERIRLEGPITFESFMDMALYDPEFGYYVSRAQRIGREGDFYTSSHLHAMFGVIIGKQIIEMWALMDSPERFTIIEMGAGEGYVCKDMLDYLKQAKSDDQGAKSSCYQNLQYVIVERNGLQRQRQQERLYAYKEKITWKQERSGVAYFRMSFLTHSLFILSGWKSNSERSMSAITVFALLSRRVIFHQMPLQGISVMPGSN